MTNGVCDVLFPFVSSRRNVINYVLVFIYSLSVGMFAGTVIAQSEQSGSPLTTSEIARRVIPTVVTLETPNGHGSGVIVDPSGVVVTNLHVIQGETQVELTLHNGDIYDDVSVVDLDERRDLVLLKIKAYNVSYANLGDSDKLEVGEDVVLVGSPEGLDLTVSEGVVSAIRDSGRGYRLIQTSAPASPGSSGGGMFNIYGELIGIVTSQISTGQNLNFAVPVNYVRGLISDEATMTLADLTERVPSTNGRNRERGNSPDDNVNLTDARKLRNIIEGIEANEDLDEILELEDAGEGLWIVTYKVLENYDSLFIGIKLIEDEFDKSLVWIRSALPGIDSELTVSQYQELLDLNLRLNIAKVAQDDDGDICTMVEAEFRTLDSLGLLRGIYAVADAADQLYEVLNSTTGQSTALRRSIQPGDSTLGYLDGAFEVRFSPRLWVEAPQETYDGFVNFDTLLSHHSEEVFVAIKAGRMKISWI